MKKLCMIQIIIAISIVPIVGLCIPTSPSVDGANQQQEERQGDPLCGPKSLLIVCEMLGIEADLLELSKLSGQSEEGTTMFGIHEAAKAKGLSSVAKKLTLAQLQKELSQNHRLAIVFVKGNHFLVVERFFKSGIRLIEYTKEAYVVPEDELAKMWQSYVLILSRKNFDLPPVRPKIQFKELDFDFGEAKQHNTISHSFKFKNIGQASLSIIKIKDFCDCTISDLPPEDLSPGETGVIPVELKLAERKARISRSVQVYTNDPEQPVIYLTITGFVEEGITFAPARIYLDGINAEEQIKRKIKLLIPNRDELQIVNVETTSEQIKAEYFPLVPDVGDNETRKCVGVGVTIGPGLPVGRVEERLFIHLRSGEKIEIPIEGTIVGSITVYPTRLFFGIIQQGIAASQQIKLSTQENKNFRIVKIESSSKFISTEAIPIKEAGEYTIKVSIQPAAPVGQLTGKVKIHTTDTQQPFIELPIYAFIKNLSEK